MLLHGARIDTERLISSTEIVDVGLFLFWSRESVIRPVLLQRTLVFMMRRSKVHTDCKYHLSDSLTLLESNKPI
jgi:hypothetical protein